MESQRGLPRGQGRPMEIRQSVVVLDRVSILAGADVIWIGLPLGGQLRFWPWSFSAPSRVWNGTIALGGGLDGARAAVAWGFPVSAPLAHIADAHLRLEGGSCRHHFPPRSEPSWAYAPH